MSQLVDERHDFVGVRHARRRLGHARHAVVARNTDHHQQGQRHRERGAYGELGFASAIHCSAAE